MGRVERHVEEKWSVTGVAIDVVNRRVGNQIRRIALVEVRLKARVPIKLTFAEVRKVVDVAVVVSEKKFETLIERMVLPRGMTDMPLADHSTIAIAGAREHLGQHFFRGRHSNLEKRAAYGPLHAETNRVSSGHQTGAGRTTNRTRVVAF